MEKDTTRQVVWVSKETRKRLAQVKLDKDLPSNEAVIEYLLSLIN